MTAFIYYIVAMLGLLAGFIIGFVTGNSIEKKELERIGEQRAYYEKECDRLYSLYCRNIDKFDRTIKEKNDIIARLTRQLNQ